MDAIRQSLKSSAITSGGETLNNFDNGKNVKHITICPKDWATNCTCSLLHVSISTHEITAIIAPNPKLTGAEQTDCKVPHVLTCTHMYSHVLTCTHMYSDQTYISSLWVAAEWRLFTGLGSLRGSISYLVRQCFYLPIHICLTVCQLLWDRVTVLLWYQGVGIVYHVKNHTDSKIGLASFCWEFMSSIQPRWERAYSYSYSSWRRRISLTQCPF